MVNCPFASFVSWSLFAIHFENTKICDFETYTFRFIIQLLRYIHLLIE